jgi:hypothetical protein
MTLYTNYKDEYCFLQHYKDEYGFGYTNIVSSLFNQFCNLIYSRQNLIYFKNQI